MFYLERNLKNKQNIKSDMYNTMKYAYLLCAILFLSLGAFGQIVRLSDSKNAWNYFLDRAQINLAKDLDSSFWYCNAVILSNAINSSAAELGRAYSIKGEIFQKRSAFEASVSNYLKAIEIGEKNHYLQLLGSAYNGLGITFYLMQNNERAEYYIRKALSIKLKQKDYVYYAIIASNLAALLVYDDKNDEALSLLKTAEKVVLNAKLPQYLPNIYNSIGAIFFQRKDAQDSSMYYYKKSIYFAEKFDVQQNIVTGYHNMGHLLLEKRQYDQALNYLKIAETISEELNSTPIILKTIQTLAETYEAAGKTSLALHYRNKELALNKQIFDSETQKSIEELQIQYETSEKDRINQEQERKLLESELRAKKASIRFYILFFSTLLIVFLVGAILIYRYQKMLTSEKINQEKIRIFENVVHDIRTPLTLIHGPLQALKSKMKNQNDDDLYFNLIERNSDKLMRMVDELLDISKMDKGKYKVAFTDGNLLLLLDSLIDDFQQEAKEKQVTLIKQLDIPNENHQFSKDVLEKIVFNLLSNAIKYAPRNSLVEIIAISNQQYLNFRVRDEGRGIAYKDQEKIFERFFRLHEHKNEPGTGIGLAVVKEFLELIGGSIRVESKPNQGASFDVFFPIEKSQNKVIESNTDETDKIQLLICDDDQDILDFVSSIFESEYSVHIVKNGKQALNFIEKNAPDVILSDVVMPEMDGIDLLENLKKNSIWRSMPVVLFSAKSALESRLKGLQAGADYYIPKPFNTEELLLVMKNITSRIDKNRTDFIQQKTEKVPFEKRIISENAYVNKTTEFVIQNIENPEYSVNELASDMCISRSQLHRKLSLFTGLSATNFIRMIRLEKAKDLLESNSGNVEEVAYSCGFSSRSYFSSSYTEYYGKTPLQTIKGE